MTKEEAIKLKDGTRVILTQVGSEWKDCGFSTVCVKIGNRFVEADIERPNDDNVWYPYYSIVEMDYVGYEFTLKFEQELDSSTSDFKNELCQIILEGEGTALGKSITIERLKDKLDYIKWCEETIDDE